MKNNSAIIAAFSGATGVGKTTLITNVSNIIQRYNTEQAKICLVDMNLFYPSIVHLFHNDDVILKEPKLNHIMHHIETLPLEVIESAAIEHTPTKIHIYTMAWGEMNIDNRLFTPEKITILLEKLRQIYDVVLVDTSANFRQDATLIPLILADKIFLVTNPDINKILHTRKIIDTFNIIDKSVITNEKLVDKVKVVLNKYNDKNGVMKETIERALSGRSVEKVIAENSRITFYGNNGQFYADQPSQEARAMIELARMVYNQEE